MIFLGSINISNMLKFLGHAGFMYETKNEMLLMDPWMSKEGAFDSSWYQFPSNHSLGDEIRNEIESTEKEVYIYISHEHKDHFDVPFLITLNLSKINFITPKFRRDHVAFVLNKLNPKSVITPVDSELLNIGNIEIRLFLDDQEIVRDSALGLIDKTFASIGIGLEIDIRGRIKRGTIVTSPFFKNGTLLN